MDTLKNSKDKYRIFCEQTEDLPLYFQPWWLDTVCSNNASWEVFLYEEKNEIKGVYVCYFVKKFGFNLVLQPIATQYNGIWLQYDTEYDNYQKLRFEKKTIQHLLAQLEVFGFSYMNQCFPLNFRNWLPFYWKGFSQTTRYTYQLDFKNSPDFYFDKFSRAKKKQIRKAENTNLQRKEMDGESFYSHWSDYHASRGDKLFVSKDFFMRLYRRAVEKNQGSIVAVADTAGEIHAALFVVWDRERAYNLLSTMHPEFRDSGASTLVVFEAIKQMYGKVGFFDFCGSIDKDIENSISQFGGEQVAYFRIKKYNSFLTKSLFPLLNL